MPPNNSLQAKIKNAEIFWDNQFYNAKKMNHKAGRPWLGPDPLMVKMASEEFEILQSYQ